MKNVMIKKVVTPTKEVLDITTIWMYDWWGKKEKYKYADVYTYMNHSFNYDKLPQTYIMYLDEKIIGMYQITYRDLFVRPDIYPWVANIYVDKEYRNKGYGKLLIRSVKTEMKNNTTFDKLFLYTTHKNLYEKYGWECIETIDENHKLYKLDLK